jgi:3-oxoacyl-[acyl-carrier protein] reductase
LRESSHGKIITFAGGGDGPLPRFTSYASSKGAILRFTESVAAELKEFHIDVNAISPGLVNSGFVENLLAAGPERAGAEKYQEALNQVSGAMATVSPDKAAALAVFLASDQSNGLTGKNISAVWDNWKDIPVHLDILSSSDVYNWRRIKPTDRGYAW